MSDSAICEPAAQSVEPGAAGSTGPDGDETYRQLLAWAAERHLEDYCPAPDPDFSASPSSVTIDGHTVQVLCDMRNPRLVVFGHLLSPNASSRTLHGGAPVADGEKWVAVKWFRHGTHV